MLYAAALVSSPPLIVPDLMGRGADEATELRASFLRAGALMGSGVDRWIALGVDGSPRIVASDAVGTFRGYGADIEVSLSPDTSAVAEHMPLAALMAAWIRTNAAPSATVEARIFDRDTPAADCAHIGAALRAEIDGQETPIGLVIIGDGATTLTATAPGAFDPRAHDVQTSIDEALSGGAVDALDALDVDLCAQLGVDGRAVWQILAGVFGTAGGGTPSSVETFYVGAPFGVGYHVGVWFP